MICSRNKLGKHREGTKNRAKNSMKNVAERLIELMKRDEPYTISKRDNGREIAKVAITNDGTWQRCGGKY